ncbi:MAG: FAD-dependent oxidoreductase [Actinomycetota bacterium]|nr:FAD-dependent oxidoreductase [Actinomycetota bacterium]
MKVAVVGAGVVGLSATACLGRAGVDVVCFERSVAAMGERSAGSSRIFRLAHVEPDLVRLAMSAQNGFARWAAEADAPMVDRSGCVISGVDVGDRAAAMDAAGAPYEIVDAPSPRVRLPAVAAPSPVLVDPAGGVVDVDAIRALLVTQTGHVVVHEPVYALDCDAAAGATVWSPSGASRYDAVVIAAGAGTSALAGQVGIYTPPSLVHHVRFTFPIDDSSRWQAWIDNPVQGMSTYQHRSGPRQWSIGGSVDPALTAWEMGRDKATAASQEAVLNYVRHRLTVQPTIIDSLYCTHVPNRGDGIEFRRNGPVLAVYGENLMKFAPVLGEALTAATVAGTTPTVRQLAAS